VWRRSGRRWGYNFFMANVLTAIHNIIAGRRFAVLDQASSSNRINRQGEPFEVFIRRALAGDFVSESETELAKKTQAVFSYASHDSSPPDLMIRGGDAIEIKKFESFANTIQLNSSYPKAVLRSDYPLLSAECRKCEDWKQKDLVYILAVIKAKKIQELWFVDGATYVASREVYESVFERIKASVHSTEGLSIKDSELGRVTRIDPLNRTQLRIRGMWLIEHPRVAFAELFSSAKSAGFRLYGVMRQEKYQQLLAQEPMLETSLKQAGCVISPKNVLDPNNRARVLEVATLQFEANHA
jgi:hypothetical protein